MDKKPKDPELVLMAGIVRFIEEKGLNQEAVSRVVNYLTDRYLYEQTQNEKNKSTSA